MVFTGWFVVLVTIEEKVSRQIFVSYQIIYSATSSSRITGGYE